MKTYSFDNTIIPESGLVEVSDAEMLLEDILSQFEDDSNDLKSRRIDSIVESAHCKAELYERYSGRAMYGKNCVGITTDNPTRIIELAAQFGILGARMDGMGMDTIVYWPKIEYVEEA